MYRYTVERSMLLRQVVTYEIETDRDLAEWLADDPWEADEAILEGTDIGEEFEGVDNDELEHAIIRKVEVA